MGSLATVLEDFVRAPRKTLESLIPSKDTFKNIFEVEEDEHADENTRLYYMLKALMKVLNNFYFKVEHVGQFPVVRRVAAKEKVLLISNHANTLEGGLICYKFLSQGLGRVRPLVFKEAFRLPILREIFKSSHCVPIGVDAGKEALKNDHILLFPEGMDFIKHYIQKDFVVKYHKGFLRIAQEYLRDTGKEHVTIQPVGHDGIDYTVKFWVINHPSLVKHVIKPFLHYPYFVLPKMPFVFPTTAVFNWGRPWRLTRDDLEDDKKLGRLSDQFRHEMMGLRRKARRIRQMIRNDVPPEAN